MKRFNVWMAIAFCVGLALVGCVKNDCDNSFIIAEWMNETDLQRREAEEGPSIRWFWCEAPLKKDGHVPEGRTGPIVNLYDESSDFGYGGWVRVLADDVSELGIILKEHVQGMPDNSAVGYPVYWAWTASAVFAYSWKDDGWLGGDTRAELTTDGAITFARYMGRYGRTPFGVKCYTIKEVRQYNEDFKECRWPSKNSPISRPDESTSSTGSGSTTGGDWGPN